MKYFWIFIVLAFCFQVGVSVGLAEALAIMEASQYD